MTETDAALILIVEDNERNAKLLRDVLDAKGYRVTEAETAELGLEIAARDKPDLVLMDIQLPGMDGMTALRHLKDDPVTATIPVIAVTASVMPMEREKVMAAGFDAFQEKPISVKNILELIADLLAGSEEAT